MLKFWLERVRIRVDVVVDPIFRGAGRGFGRTSGVRTLVVPTETATPVAGLLDGHREAFTDDRRHRHRPPTEDRFRSAAVRAREAIESTEVDPVT